MEEKNENNIELQKEAEQTAYQTVREEPPKQVETFNNQTVTIIEKNKKSKNGIFFVIGLLIIVLISVGGFFLFQNYPKYMLVKSLDNWTDSLEVFGKPMKGIKNYNWDELTTKGTTKFELGEVFSSELFGYPQDDENLLLLKKLESLSFEMEARVSVPQKKTYINLVGNIANEKVLDIGYLNYDNKQYLLLKEVMEKYLELEETQDLYSENTDNQAFNEDANYVWNVFKKSLKKNLKPSYIKKQNEKIIVDGKTVNTTKISLVIDENIDYELTNNIIKDLKADKRANDFIVKLYPEFENYTVQKKESSYTIRYSVNVTKGLPKVVKMSFSSDGKDLFTLTKGNSYVMEFLENGEVVMTATTTEEKDGFETVLTFQENDMQMIFNGNREDNNVVYSLGVKQSGMTIEMILNMLLEETKEQDALKEKAELAINVTAQGIKIPVATAKFDFETTKGAEFEEIKDSVLVTDLSEAEQEKIEAYLENFTKLLEI